MPTPRSVDVHRCWSGSSWSYPSTRTVRTGIGSAAPTPVRAKTAEEFLNAALDEGGFWDNGKIITPSVAKQFADLCSAACNPIDDVRGTASYRRHAEKATRRCPGRRAG